MIVNRLSQMETPLQDGDVVVVTHKVVSKAEGQVRQLDPDDPDSYQKLVEEEANVILRRRGELTITQTQHGFICANAGVDRSNVATGEAVLLPRDPDYSARAIRARIRQSMGLTVAVLITDTFGRVWRHGLVDVAIGVAGISPIEDLRGQTDAYGRVMEATEIALVDEIAAAADLVMGKTRGVPVAVVRGVFYRVVERAQMSALIREPQTDMFR